MSHSIGQQTARACTLFCGRVLLFFVLVLSAAAYADAEVDALLTRFTDNHNKVLESLKSLNAEQNLNPQTALEAIQRDLSPMVNFDKLASTSAGKYWRKATDAEKTETRQILQKVLELNLARVLAKFSGQEVKILGAQKRGKKRVLISTEVQGGEVVASIEYVFAGLDAQAKIIDVKVKVEGVDLLAAYRRQFRQTLKKEGFAGLIEQLNQMLVVSAQ